jgi:hypothetical protein
MSQPPERIDSERLLARALGPGGPELSCDECFAQLDRYVELELAGFAAASGQVGSRDTYLPKPHPA